MYYWLHDITLSSNKDASRYKFLVQMLEAKVSCHQNTQWSLELSVNSEYSGNLITEV